MYITCDQMKKIDQYAITSLGIPSLVLMERAGLNIVHHMDLEVQQEFTLVCGTGNNGGDGLVVARELIQRQKPVHLYIIGNIKKASEDFKVNLNILNQLNFNYKTISTKNNLEELKDSILKSDLVVDSIFGIGLKREVEGLYHDLIQTINEFSKNILAVDLPSGLNGDTGQVLGVAIRANKTITFHLAKKGLKNAKNYTGEVFVEDIGIPKKASENILSKKIGWTNL